MVVVLLAREVLANAMLEATEVVREVLAIATGEVGEDVDVEVMMLGSLEHTVAVSSMLLYVIVLKQCVSACSMLYLCGARCNCVVALHKSDIYCATAQSVQRSLAA